MQQNTENNIETKYSQVFDWACKTIMNMSHKSIINFINGLFKKNYPEDSKISFHSTEFVRSDTRKLFADFLLSINKEKYHMEFQLQKDETIALRVFEYCFEEAKKTRNEKENEILLHFAETKVIYLRADKNIPEEYIIRFKMPSGEEFCYKVPVIQLLSKDIPEIVEEKLVLLLPLYQLKMRNITKMTPENRKKHIQEFKNMLNNMEHALIQSLNSGLISGGDYAKLLNITGTLYKYLYVNTKNMEEVDEMVEEKFTTYMEDIEKKVIKKATEQGLKQGIAQGIEQGMAQGIEQGMAQGMAQGIEQGIEQGMAKGMAQGMKITYLITKNPGMSDEEISSQTGNDIETINKIRKSLMEFNLIK